MPGRHAQRPRRLSVRAFAKLLDVSHTAVQKGIAAGRLKGSVERDARGWFIRDQALAARLWSSGAAQAPNNGARGAQRSHASGTLVEAQVRVARERAAALELANRRRRGESLDAATVEREQFECARMLRERILNVVSRMGDLGADIRTRLRSELLQALSGFADDLERGE